MPTKKQLANLKRGELSTEQASKIGKLGGLASVKAKKERKTLRETLLLLAETQLADGKTVQETIALALASKAMSGNVDAIKTFRDSIGESPTNKVEVTEGESKRSASDLFAALGAMKK